MLAKNRGTYTFQELVTLVFRCLLSYHWCSIGEKLKEIGGLRDGEGWRWGGGEDLNLHFLGVVTLLYMVINFQIFLNFNIGSHSFVNVILLIMTH